MSQVLEAGVSYILITKLSTYTFSSETLLMGNLKLV
jgi:hypothetical protein